MPCTRRSLLQLPVLAVVATGCASSPVIVGTPGDVPASVPPTRSAEAEAVATWVERFAALVDGLSLTSAAWAPDETSLVWITALQDQASAHLSRVVTADPVTGGPTVFPAQGPQATSSPSPATLEEALVLLTDEVAIGLPILRTGLTAASVGQDRLFHASLATAVTASLAPTLPPMEGGAAPAPFDDPDVSHTTRAALEHARALIRGLELGLGRLPSSDALSEAGTERLDAVRRLRNTLIASLPDDLPEIDVWQFPNDMATSAEILGAWAVLESNLLDAFGVLTAADSSGAADWLDLMLGQVPWVHRWSGQLPYWPGWVSPS